MSDELARELSDFFTRLAASQKPLPEYAAKVLNEKAWDLYNDDPPPPTCPNCDCRLQPERIGAGRYVCPGCARVFHVPPKG